CLRRGKGPFPAGRVLSLPCGERGLPRASAGLCARVCVSFPPCPGTPRVKRFQIGPLFLMGGADIGREKENDFPLFSPKNLPLSAPRSTHTAQPFWKNQIGRAHA